MRSNSVTQPRYFSFPEIAGQNAWLDLLRSAAILLVLLRHGERAIAAQLGEIPPSPLHSVFMNGWVGVDLFLVLSGYLIGKSLLRTLGASTSIDMSNYFRARVLRIVPAYFFVLVIVAIGAIPFFEVARDDIGRRVLYHALFLQDYLPADINVVFWSLGVEEKFYLLAPLLLFGLLKLQRTSCGLAALAALFLLSPAIKLVQFAAHPVDAYQAFFSTFRSPFHLSLEPLVVGVSISYLRERKLVQLSPKSARLLFVAATLAALAWLASHEFLASIHLFDVTAQPMVISLLFGCLVLSATFLDAPVSGEAQVWRPISRLSYSLYLVHFPLIPLCLTIASPVGFAGAGFWIIYMTVAFLIAAALHFSVEKPFLLLKDSMARRSRLPAVNT
jgi:peptidoglycan/LPS O-acetylase OafA/YrhL